MTSIEHFNIIFLFSVCVSGKLMDFNLDITKNVRTCRLKIWKIKPISLQYFENYYLYLTYTGFVVFKYRSWNTPQSRNRPQNIQIGVFKDSSCIRRY